MRTGTGMATVGGHVDVITAAVAVTIPMRSIRTRSWGRGITSTACTDPRIGTLIYIHIYYVLRICGNCIKC